MKILSRLNFLSLKDVDGSGLKFYSSRTIGIKNIIITAFLVALALTLIYLSSFGENLDISLGRRIDFSLRQLLGRQPKRDPRLKLIALDDQTTASINNVDLSLEEWRLFLEALGKQKPKAIIIDKVFGLYAATVEEEQKFVETIKNYPIFAGCFISDVKILSRKRMPIQTPTYKIKDIIARSPSPPNLTPDDLYWLKQNPGVPYGPDQKIIAGFRGIGHIAYNQNSMIDAFKRNDTEYAIPHLAFYAADNYYIDNIGPVVNGHRVYVDSHGQFLVNLMSQREYYDFTFSMKGELLKAKNGDLIPLVREGDVVVILPRMYTGNIELRDTPAGKTPGGFIVAGIVNSILTGQWLEPINIGIILIWISAALGLMVSMAFFSGGIILSFFLIPLLIFSIGTVCFSFFNLIIPWLFPCFSIMLTGILIFYQRFLVADEKSRMLKVALRKAVPPERLRHILKDPDSLQLEASEQVVTTMFIDIVGFSLTAERQTPKEIFSGLKEIIATARKIIHHYGGVVDKTIGDGIFCFFGYSYQSAMHNKPVEDDKGNHVAQALNCAIEIQRVNLENCLKKHKDNKAIYPLRMGINTSTVYVGDLGDQEAIDLTLVGHGVNYAKRLEEGCDLFKIMLGPTSKDLLGLSNEHVKSLKLRHLTIKHHKETLEAYEYDPFLNDQELLGKALRSYKEFAGFERREPRWPIPANKKIIVHTDFGEGELVDVSYSGLSVKMKHYFAKGVEISFTLEDEKEIEKELAIKGLLPPIVGQVRWGRVTGDNEYLHGLLLKNLHDKQKEKLLNLLRARATD